MQKILSHRSIHRFTRRPLSTGLWLLTLGALFFSTASLAAGTKIGENPLTLDPDHVLEVEASDGNKVWVNDSDGRMYIENTTAATLSDSIVFKGADGEFKTMTFSELQAALNQ